MRSRGNAIDAGAVCETLGGGGHPGAGGCIVDVGLIEARKRAESALATALGMPAPADGEDSA